MDLQLESGEYFLSEAQKNQKKLEEKRQASADKKKAKLEERNKQFVAPTPQVCADGCAFVRPASVARV